MTEEPPHVANQQVGHLMGGVVAAAIELLPVDDVLVVAFGEAADRVEVVGENGHAGRCRGRLGRFVLGVEVLVVLAG